MAYCWGSLPLIAKDKVFFMRSESPGVVHTFGIIFSLCSNKKCKGFGKHGALGIGSFEDKNLPQLVKSIQNEKIVKIACGGEKKCLLCNKL